MLANTKNSKNQIKKLVKVLVTFILVNSSLKTLQHIFLSDTLFNFKLNKLRL